MLKREAPCLQIKLERELLHIQDIRTYLVSLTDSTGLVQAICIKHAAFLLQFPTFLICIIKLTEYTNGPYSLTPGLRKKKIQVVFLRF